MLRIEQTAATRLGDGWRVTWRIHNPDPTPVEISRAWLPHSQFRSPELELQPELIIPPDAEGSLDTVVTCPDEPGAVVENAFLILRLRDQRVFARLRVRVQLEGRPEAVVESVTSQ